METMLKWVRYSNSLGWFNVQGRARRSEYWFNYLFYVLIAIVLMIITTVLNGIAAAIDVDILSMLVGLVTGLVTLAYSIYQTCRLIPIMIRRFHDRGITGWAIIACYLGSVCCGIGAIVSLIICVLDSQPGTNQYGPNPKGIDNGGMNMSGYNQQMGGYNQQMGGYNQQMGGYNQQMNGMNMGGQQMGQQPYNPQMNQQMNQNPYNQQ